MPNRILVIGLLAGFLPAALGCMAGYEDERDRLREHLGIEWLPHGLDKTAVSDKTIRRSTDLNCDFSSPKECRWKNMEARHEMDSLDFHLFEKVDWTEFPALQVRPGPSKVAQGDKMIFTGDRKREEQSAIYYSSPIGCQNATGNLTFTFWVYNDARVEVLLLEDRPGGKLKELAEKPYVDCGTISLNTECHADIPARQTPFRLAIRAYDIANKEGSFVMVDQIMYSAPLCNVGVDLGDNFLTKPLITAAMGKDISLASQLDCADFDEKCRWRSGGQSDKMWRRSTSPLPREFLYNTTGSYMGPSGAYAVLYIDQGSKRPLDVLKADPIPCQSQTENKLSFRWWATRDVRLEIQIRVASFSPDFDSVVIIDDLTYRATLCTDPLSVELVPDVWQVGHGPLNEEKLYSLSGQTRTPDGEFAVAKFETGGSSLLLSEVIRCVLDDVSISFNMWATGTASLQVCLVEESSPSLLDCQPAASGPGSVCPAFARQFASKHFSPSVEHPDPNVCRLLSCDFSHGHACLYTHNTVPGSAPFRVTNAGARATISKGRPVAVLESVPFRLNTIGRLHFTYATTGDASLYVCNDSVKKELESCFKVEGSDGEDYIELLPSDTKVYLIGRLSEHSLDLGSLRIMNLTLTDTIDEPAC
ncbi:unnamed protein product, partial [Mesorhabditis spiculigera]